MAALRARCRRRRGRAPWPPRERSRRGGHRSAAQRHAVGSVPVEGGGEGGGEEGEEGSHRRRAACSAAACTACTAPLLCIACTAPLRNAQPQATSLRRLPLSPAVRPAPSNASHMTPPDSPPSRKISKADSRGRLSIGCAPDRGAVVCGTPDGQETFKTPPHHQATSPRKLDPKFHPNCEAFPSCCGTAPAGTRQTPAHRNVNDVRRLRGRRAGGRCAHHCCTRSAPPLLLYHCCCCTTAAAAPVKLLQPSVAHHSAAATPQQQPSP